MIKRQSSRIFIKRNQKSVFALFRNLSFTWRYVCLITYLCFLRTRVSLDLKPNPRRINYETATEISSTSVQLVMLLDLISNLSRDSFCFRSLLKPCTERKVSFRCFCSFTSTHRLKRTHKSKSQLKFFLLK